MFKKLLALALAVKMAEQLEALCATVTFFQLFESKPDATDAEVDAERDRLFKEAVDKMEEIPKAPGSERAAFKAALLYLAGQL